MTIYTFHYVGFNSQQQEAISAILDLADSALTCSWNPITDEGSDVIMVNLDAEDGQRLYQTELQNRPIYRIIAVTEDTSKANQDGWFLCKKPYAPPSLKEFAVLLNELAILLADETNANTAGLPENTDLANTQADATDATANPSESAIPSTGQEAEATDNNTEQLFTVIRPLTAGNYFFGILMQAKQDKSCRIIKLDTAAELYLSPTENCYYFAGSETELLQYCTVAPEYLSETVVTKAKLNKTIINNKLTAQPLDDLLIYAVLKAASGYLLEGHNPEQKVKLKRLPDSKKKPLLANYQNIAEKLQKQPDNLFNVAEALQVPISQVFDFYNICSVMGYLNTEELTKSNEQKSGTLSHFLKSFFSK